MLGRETLEDGETATVAFARDEPGCRWTLLVQFRTRQRGVWPGVDLCAVSAGLQATVVVWIAPEFREEDRAAIDWLNQASLQGFDFFAVQIEAYRIGESIAVPHFNIVAKPNTWTKQATAAKLVNEESEGKQRWNDYWTGLKELARERFLH